MKTPKTETSNRKVYIPSYVRTKMKQIIKKEGLPDVVFHSLRHTSVTYKLKLSGGDIKAVQGDSGHAQADMVTEVYGHILDEDRKKNAQLMKVLGNPEKAALLTSLAKSMNLNDPPEMVHRSTKNMKKILDVGFII